MSVKKDISNLSSKIQPKFVPNVHLNARPVLKVLPNVPHVTLQSTELKVMTHWEEEPVSVKLVIMPYQMDHVFNPTVNPTNIAVNVKPILPFVSNVMLMPTELSNFQNTSVFVLMDSMKESMELVSHAVKVVPSVHLQLNVTAVLLKPLTTVMEHANAQLEHSSKSQPTE